MIILRRAYERWQIITHITGDYMAGAIAIGFYYTIFAFFAIIAHFNLPRSEAKEWLNRTEHGQSLDQARNQF